MYQVYAYGKEYACPVNILLYPMTPNVKANVATYRHHPLDASEASIHICSIDLTDTGKSHRTVAEQLRGLLTNLLVLQTEEPSTPMEIGA
ncbi:hypothetical protein K2Y11_18055 [bacterium]|nr:hypothetical protein [bacterium]